MKYDVKTGEDLPIGTINDLLDRGYKLIGFSVCPVGYGVKKYYIFAKEME